MAAKGFAEMARYWRHRRRDMIEAAKLRAASMTPEEIFIARCDATMRPAKDPCIDPEADIDRPGEEEWK